MPESEFASRRDFFLRALADSPVELVSRNHEHRTGGVVEYARRNAPEQSPLHGAPAVRPQDEESRGKPLGRDADLVYGKTTKHDSTGLDAGFLGA